MYIEPNTNILILKDVPLDSTYENTIYFDSLNEQYNYFTSQLASPIHRLSNQTYQRVNNGVMRVMISADKCYNCNYLMFQNASYKNIDGKTKWFYAFITNVEYVNNDACNIYFEIDELQTWLFDIELLPSYIEREHSSSDNIGDNILEEQVPIGEHIANEVTYKFFDDLRVVIQYIKNEQEWVEQGAFYGKIYSGLETVIPQNTTADINGSIKNIQSNGGKVVSIYMTPNEFIPRADNVGTVYEFDSTMKVTGEHGLLNGYKPRNKKLFTYPYNYCNVSASNGASVDYMFEYDFNQMFKLYTNMANNVSVTLCNIGYKGVHWNFVDSITLDNFPICAWSDSAFTEYLGTQAIADTLKGIINIASGTLVSGAVGGGVAVGGVNKLIDVVNMRNKPMRLGNTGNNVNNLMNNGKYGFTFSRLTVKKEIAEVIDNYFDMYGYATHLTKVPNRNVRPHWTYTKTSGCAVKSSAPVDATKKVCSIYDKGIRFWKYGSEVGNYSLDNTIGKEE